MGSTASRLHVVFRFGPFELSERDGELRKNGVRIKLQEQPFRVLVELLANAGTLVTREELQQKLWPADTFVDFDVGLNSAIRKIRQALGDDADHPRYIETAAKRGYRFLVPVTKTTGDAAVNSESPATSSAAGVPVTPLEPETQIEVRHGGRWRNWPVAMIVATVVALLAVFLWLKIRSAPPSGDQPIHSLAVLPLTNLSHDPEQEYFADGMTEALITELSQISSLKVISRTSAMHYKGSNKPLPEIGKELNVDGIIEGSVQRADGRVRISAQLVNAATDTDLWAKSY